MKPRQLYFKYDQTKRSAERRGLDFDLSLRDIENLCDQKYCAYSGEKFSTGKKVKEKEKLTFERLDNNKGYVKGNVVPVKLKYNNLRGNLELAELKAIYRDPYQGPKNVRTIIDVMMNSNKSYLKSRYDKYLNLHETTQKSIAKYQRHVKSVIEGLEKLENVSYIDSLKLRYCLPLSSSKKELLKEIYVRIRSSL